MTTFSITQSGISRRTSVFTVAADGNRATFSTESDAFGFAASVADGEEFTVKWRTWSRRYTMIYGC